MPGQQADRPVAADQCDSFSLGLEGSEPLRAADFALRERPRRGIASQGGKRVVLQLASDRHDAAIELQYTLGDHDFFLRRQIVLQTKRPLPLRRVDVWSVGVEGKAAHQGFGEPVFLGDTFWGLEYPGGHNAYANGTVTLSHYPGRTVTDRFVSKTAVLGVAAKEPWPGGSSDTSRPSRRRRKPPSCSSTTTPGGR